MAAAARKQEEEKEGEVAYSEVDVHNPRSHRADYYASGTCKRDV